MALVQMGHGARAARLVEWPSITCVATTPPTGMTGANYDDGTCFPEETFHGDF